MASIRERVRQNIWREWNAGNLIPADEVQARIDSAVSEAVREERARAAKVAEELSKSCSESKMNESNPRIERLFGAQAAALTTCANAIRETG